MKKISVILLSFLLSSCFGYDPKSKARADEEDARYRLFLRYNDSVQRYHSVAWRVMGDEQQYRCVMVNADYYMRLMDSLYPKVIVRAAPAPIEKLFNNNCYPVKK